MTFDSLRAAGLGPRVLFGCIAACGMAAAASAQDAVPADTPAPPPLVSRTPILALAESALRQDARAASTAASAAAGTATGGQRPPARAYGAPIPRPMMSGSSTGYVDNAIIGSQIRFRFDAAAGGDAPDRSEFFYAKCGCYREAGLDPDAPGPAPALAGRDPATTRFVETGIDYEEFQANVEYAPSRRFSVFADLPFRSISPEVNADASGLGDIRAGVKVGLVATEATALTFQFRSYFDTGEALKGLGTAHPSLEFTVLFNQKLSDRVSLSGEVGDWHPLDPSSGIPVSATEDWADDVIRWGVGTSFDLAASPSFRFAPVVEFVGWSFRGGFVTTTLDGTGATTAPVSAEGVNVANLKLGARTTFSGRHSVYAGYGFPLTDAQVYDHIVRVEYRYVF